ncbi:MAG: ABC transporter ATP-binding protein [Saprospiraceae bacterium]|nr:ABC transporter ATP-binding protein [Saprospiraceae bacterium]MBP7679930.1 ABC transporter ATP-binding protein [Saprospiraceae bacterium]
MKELAYLNRYFWKYKHLLIQGFIFVVISNYFRILQPQMIRKALDTVVDNVQSYNAASGQAKIDLYNSLASTLMYFGLVVLGAALCMGVFMYFMRQTIIVMSRLIEYDLRKEIFEQYQRLSLSFYKRNNTGDMMSRITEDVSKVRMYLGPTVLYGINILSLVVLVISGMLSVSVKLTLYTLLPLPLLSISIYYVSALINKKSEAIQKQLAVLNSAAQEIYSGIRVVKSYAQEKPMATYFAQECETYKQKSMELVRVDALFFPTMIILIGASTILTIYIGGLGVANGEITHGNIAEFVIYVNMLTWPITSIGWTASLIQQAAASQKRINGFLHITPDIVSPKGAIAVPIQGEVAFRNVTFTYPDTGITALHNVSFSLKKGEKMAIIGRTGSGKSTVADLLVRMYDVTEGEILIDNKNIKEYDLHHLRRSIGYVQQDVFLFSDSVSANVAFGKADASQQQIEEFTKYAAVHNDIIDLPNGFNTVIGERGVMLSGGQKQRISIARTLIKNPEIVILDDSLSAVDTTTEQRILGYLNQNLADKTAVIITHRIYGLLNFDKIIVLDGGRIVEAGKHEELIAQKGYYFDLFEQQRAAEAAMLNVPTG